MSTAERIRLPDDCTVGYIVEALLGVPLIRSGLFHSHLESLQQVPTSELHQQVRGRWGRERRRGRQEGPCCWLPPRHPSPPSARTPRRCSFSLFPLLVFSLTYLLCAFWASSRSQRSGLFLGRQSRCGVVPVARLPFFLVRGGQKARLSPRLRPCGWPRAEPGVGPGLASLCASPCR